MVRINTASVRWSHSGLFLVLCVLGISFIVGSSFIMDVSGLPFVKYGYTREAELIPYVRMFINFAVFSALGIAHMLMAKTMTSVEIIHTYSPHQQFAKGLYRSGQSHTYMTAAWERYYEQLDEAGKQAVWQEYESAILGSV